MAWPWSHTAEGIKDARENVLAKDRDWLRVVYAEWKACPDPSAVCPDFDQASYDEALAEAERMPADILAEFIWERMEALALCTHGGHEAWGCPFGCGCHRVPFHRESGDRGQSD